MDVKIFFFIRSTNQPFFSWKSIIVCLNSIFFLDYRFLRHGDGWLLEHTGNKMWGLMQPSKRVVERQAYKQTGHEDWTDGLRTRLATRHLLSRVMKLCRHRFIPVVYYTPLSPFLPHTRCCWLNVPVTDPFHWWGGERDWQAWPPVGV